MELLWEIGWTPLSLMLIAGKDEEIEGSELKHRQLSWTFTKLSWKLSRNLHQFAALVSEGSLWNGKFMQKLW